MKTMDSFLKGLSHVIVVRATPPETAMRLAWEAVGRDMWWAISEFNEENNILLESEQSGHPIASAPK
jgi:hypothetical protein